MHIFISVYILFVSPTYPKCFSCLNIKTHRALVANSGFLGESTALGVLPMHATSPCQLQCSKMINVGHYFIHSFRKKEHC